MTSATWLHVFVRAVLVPASRRVAPAWVGCGIVGGLFFGRNAMHPHDVTTLARNNVPIGVTLCAIWLLLFLPTARLLIRRDGAAFLASLPAPRWSPSLLVALALVVLQLPWLVLWLGGERVLGVAFVAAMTVVIAALAAVRFPRRAARTPAWSRPLTALAAVHARALVRRAGDALVRGTGLAILAGCVAGLFVRNNQLHGADAATLGASTIAVILVPAHAGPLVTIVQSHRASAWLADTLGLSPITRTAALLLAIALVQLAATAVALAGFIAIAEWNPYVIATALAIAVGSSFGLARALIADDETSKVAARAVIGALLAAAAAIAALTALGLLGIIAFVAAMLLVLLR